VSTIRIELKMTGSTYVELDREKYEEARAAHEGGGLFSRLDKLLDGPIGDMDTEVTVIEPDGSEYQL
jgi:hypothetical protein